jgi:hypothetical protein
MRARFLTMLVTLATASAVLAPIAAAAGRWG